MTTEVLIIGAGPTGLTMANLLARHNINFRIIEKNAGPTDKSKALIVQARTLELFDKIGLAAQAIDWGQRATSVNFLIRGKRVGVFPLNDQGKARTPYPFALLLEQSKTERLLLEGLKDTNTQVEWNTELLSLTLKNDQAKAVIKHFDGREEIITTNWVVGADGASSPVRHALHLGFEGGTYENSFFLADVNMDWPLGHDELYVNLTHEGFFGFLPMYGDHHFRILGSLTPELSAKSDISFEDVCKVVEQQSGLDIKLSDARWISTYRLHHRMAERFRVGCCFLVGDAAHVHSPAGGQGMNTGIQDAYNLAWKLALVVKKQAHPSLLDSYEAERMPVARTLLKGTDSVFSLELGTNKFTKQLRLYILPYLAHVITHLGFTKAAFFKVLSQIGIQYRHSSIVAESSPTTRSAHSPKAGDRTPYGFLDASHWRRATCYEWEKHFIPIKRRDKSRQDKNSPHSPLPTPYSPCFLEASSNEHISLFTLLKGTDHHLLLFEGLQPDSNFDKLQKDLRQLLTRYKIPISILLIPKEHQSLHKRYNAQKSSVFLLRPDDYIAYKGQLSDLDDLKAYLDKLYMFSINLRSSP